MERIDLKGHSILIVGATPMRNLQCAIEQANAKTVVARDRGMALEMCRRYRFSAALINIDLSRLAKQLDMPVFLFVANQPPQEIVRVLGWMLAP